MGGAGALGFCIPRVSKPKERAKFQRRSEISLNGILLGSRWMPRLS